MSQRALRKRDQMLNTYRQQRGNDQHYNHHHKIDRQSEQAIDTNGNLNGNGIIAKDKFGSTPNLLDTSENASATDAASVSTLDVENLLSPNESSRSESDLTRLRDKNTLVNATSEFHLKSIASTRVVPQPDTHYVNGNNRRNSVTKTTPQIKMSTKSAPASSRITSCSVSSTVSDSVQLPPRSPSIGFADTSTIRVPIIGYEVMEERARFTVWPLYYIPSPSFTELTVMNVFQVYKLRVENPFTNDCWLVLRRYTDFQRLNNKLKSDFPHINLTLPRKKIFGDNFSSVFLSNRVQGLQAFINIVMANEHLRQSQIVRDFFCLDEPPAYSDSMEECRAIFEAQEETIAHLKLQLRAKEDIILTLQQELNEEIEKNETLVTAVK